MTNHPNRAITYTVLNRHGEVQGEGESLISAAQIVLGYDGYEHEIRKSAGADKGFDLWTSNASRNSTSYRGLSKSSIYSLHEDAALAEAEIYRKVIRNADWWSGCVVLTDANYAAEMAELSAQHESEDD